MMTKWERELESVWQILKDWDPIGVIDSLVDADIPPNEYATYAPAILRRLEMGAGVDARVVHLGHIQKLNMGPAPWPDRDRRIAGRLVAWWESR